MLLQFPTLFSPLLFKPISIPPFPTHPQNPSRIPSSQSLSGCVQLWQLTGSVCTSSVLEPSHSQQSTLVVNCPLTQSFASAVFAPPATARAVVCHSMEHVAVAGCAENGGELGDPAFAAAVGQSEDSCMMGSVYRLWRDGWWVIL